MGFKSLLSKIKSIKRSAIKGISANYYIKNKINSIKEYALSDYTVPVIGYGDLNIDVYDKGNKIEIKIEIPGVTENNIKITSQENKLIINAEKKSESLKGNKDYYIMECAYGSFMRTIPLPFKINHDKVTANLEKGVLTIMVPKPNDLENEEKVIEIKKSK